METEERKLVSVEIRNKIIEEAIHIFHAEGLKFTMQEVAASLHISKKTIYAYFESKEELLIAMLDTGFASIHEGKRKILESDLPTADKIAAVMIAMPDKYNYIDFRQLSSLHDKYPLANSALIRHLESDWEPVTELIEKGIWEGVIRNISIPLLRVMFTASIEAFLSTDTLVRENIPYNEALNGMMDIIMRGIREDAHV